MKTLIYIGASVLQVPAIAWAKAQGLRVVVTDTNPNAPGIALADDYKQIAGDDVDGLVALAKDLKNTQDLAGCYCGSDFGLMAVACVGAVCLTPAPKPQNVERALNKFTSTNVLRETGVSVPQGGCVESFADLKSLATTIGYPIIVKPIDSSGSRGVRTVLNPTELEEAFKEAQKFSKAIMVERVIEGDHIDVNGLFIDDVFYPCGLLSRFFSPQPFNYPVWGGEPCLLNDAACQAVYDVVEAGARALGLTHGPVKADVIVSKDGPVVLEIAPRFHGDVSTSFVTPLATGNSASQAWFAYLAGHSFKEFLPNDTGASMSGWMGVFPDQPGRFDGLDGIEDALKTPGIDRIETIKKPGYKVDAIADNLAVMGFIWGQGDDLTGLYHNLLKARQLINVRMQDCCLNP